MTITLTEAIATLKSGQKLTWQKSGSFKAGAVELKAAGARRLFQFLAEADANAVGSGDERLFQGLIAAWEAESVDPGNTKQVATAGAASGPWRLKTIEATGFGGLNTYNGPAFALNVGGENWCLEGYNGSGKTSLANLILWTLTGYRNREQDGPVKDDGKRAPVLNANGKAVGSWPPLATYPTDQAKLNQDARVWARLTFADPHGGMAIAERSIKSPANVEPSVEETIDARLLAAPELIETGLLMPARIAHIGFGSKSGTLYEALKKLTGFEQLAAIAVGAGALCHKSKKFLRYAKDNGADGLERDFANNLGQARELTRNTQIDLSKQYELGASKLLDELKGTQEAASTQAGEALALLRAEVADTVDLNRNQGRDRLNKAVQAARHYLSDSKDSVPLFKLWAALKSAGDSGWPGTIREALENASNSVREAVAWHDKQQRDKKFRLKALASKFFVAEDQLARAAECPLCESSLTSENQKALAAELATLNANADAAERAIADACGDIEKALSKQVPDTLRKHLPELARMNPGLAFADALNVRFVGSAPFNDVLTGIAAFVKERVEAQAALLPAYAYTGRDYPASEIPDVTRLHDLMGRLDSIAALVDWWSEHRDKFVEAWRALIGVANESNEWPEDSLEGRLEKLETAIAQSEPLDKIARHLEKAVEAARKWKTLNEIQLVRDAIAEAVTPLKDLQGFVDCETHRVVETLSNRVSDILKDIRLQERFSFENTAISKKAVTVEGSFAPGLKIDASLVANSSWLRALLWAFIFALRDQAIEDRGENPFPLVVLDDPQMTFDPKNKRKWAEKIVKIANLLPSDAGGMQLFVTTHERQFYEIVCTTCELRGQEAKMAGPTASSKVAHIVNGTFLNRQFEKAEKDGDNEEGYRYVQQVRVYCEDLLKIMLRPESYEISGDTLGKLSELLTKLHNDHIDPFNRSTFLNLANLLNEKKNQTVKVINASHHSYDGTIGFAEAKDVEKFWREKLRPAFVNAFRLAADYDAYGGVPRFFSWPENIISFPNGHTGALKALQFQNTGFAAAAETDGKVGDGQISLQQWEQGKTIKLYNHSAYRLSSGTLDPVAGPGDVVLVQNFGAPRSRNLVVAAYGEQLFARRLNESRDHPDVVILTAQATDPYSIAEPLIALKSKVTLQKIVGTVFLPQLRAISTEDEGEVSAVDDFAALAARLKNVKLLEVKGRSMEPIALEGQFVMTQSESLDRATLRRLSGFLVIAVDQEGSVYFKRLRQHGNLVALESANSNMTTTSELLSLEPDGAYPQLVSLMSVVGVLFDAPDQASIKLTGSAA